MSLTHACTVAQPEDVAAVRVLRDALRAHHPELLPLTVLALPGARAHLVGEPDLRLLRLDDLGLAAEGVHARLLPRDLATYARAALLRELLEDDGARGVLVLPPDTDIRAPLTAFDDALAEHAVVLVPRLTGRLPDDDQRPDAADLLASGETDDELLAVAGDDRGARFAAWWVQRCEEALPGALPEPDEDPRELPRALDVAGRVLDGIGHLDDPGYDVSAWNVHERAVTLADDGTFTAGGHALALVRFSGFRADRPWWLADQATRTPILDDPALRELCRQRAEALLAAGWTAPGDATTGELLANRIRLDDRLRRLHAQAFDEGEDFGDLEEPGAADRFLDWLTGPAPKGGRAGITRYAYDVWHQRGDLQGVYPDLDGEDADGFLGWLWVHGRTEMQLEERLLPPAPDWVQDAEQTVPTVLAMGYLRGNLGLGEAARGYVKAMRAAGVPVGTRTIPLDGPQDDRGATRRRADEIAYEDETLPEAPDVVLACVNAPELSQLVERAGADVLQGSYVIGQWGWEVDVVPRWWEPAMELVDEIWVYSTYVADRMSAVSAKPVVTVPLPIERPAEIAADPGVDLPEGFLFLFAFDFLSTLQRKNPIGLIEAFKAAFTPGEGPTLVLKTINAHFRPAERDRLRFLIGDRPDIVLLDAMLPPPQMAALFARADSYVSLHRAEGFGLTLAESMILGKPVVATDFGGNTDFMRPANSYLVDYELTEVGPEGEHYPANGIWAEPSVAHAAHVLREVYDDRDGAAARGARAALDIEAQLSPAAVGAIARRRLERIAGTGRGSSSTLPWPIDELEQRVRFPLHGNGATGMRGRAQQAVMRAIRPYTARERELDEALAVSVRRIALDLEHAQSARERDRARIARLEQELRALQRER